MQRVKFISGKQLTVAAICRMMRNHLHSFYGWGDSKAESHAEMEIKELSDACPVSDLNQMLSIKNYIKWGAGLRDLEWSIDIHEIILTHSFVLNLDIPQYEPGVLEAFNQMKYLKLQKKSINTKVSILKKEADSIDEQLSALHKKVFKMKMD